MFELGEQQLVWWSCLNVTWSSLYILASSSWEVNYVFHSHCTYAKWWINLGGHGHHSEFSNWYHRCWEGSSDALEYLMIICQLFGNGSCSELRFKSINGSTIVWRKYIILIKKLFTKSWVILFSISLMLLMLKLNFETMSSSVYDSTQFLHGCDCGGKMDVHHK